MTALILLMLALAVLTVGLVIYAIYAPSMPSALDQRYQKAKADLDAMEREAAEEAVNDCDFGNDSHCQAFADCVETSQNLFKDHANLEYSEK